MPKISVLIRFYDDLSASITLPGLDPSVNKISDIQNLIELKLGIPVDLQELSYLDKSGLVSWRTLEYYSIANRARLKLTLISELDWKNIILASRNSDFKILKDHGVISNKVLAVNSFKKRSETTVCNPRKTVKKVVVDRSHNSGNFPKSRKTVMKKFKLADRSVTSIECKNSDYKNLTPMKRFDLSVERSRIVEKSFDRTQEQVQGDVALNRGIYTFWRALNSNKSIENIQKTDKESWGNYRKFICALSALSCENYVLLKIIHDENPEIFGKQRTKNTKRSVVHIASAMGNLQGLKMILYKFKGIYEIMREKDCKGLTASGLAKSVGQKHCGQVLLYYDWQKRNAIAGQGFVEGFVEKHAN